MIETLVAGTRYLYLTSARLFRHLKAPTGIFIVPLCSKIAKLTIFLVVLNSTVKISSTGKVIFTNPIDTNFPLIFSNSRKIKSLALKKIPSSSSLVSANVQYGNQLSGQYHSHPSLSKSYKHSCNSL